MAEIDDILKKLEDVRRFLVDIKRKQIVTERTVKKEEPKPKIEPSISFEELKKLLLSDKWPAAVDPNLICDATAEAAKKIRAEGIVDFVVHVPVIAKKFLDFGCGEGHTIKTAIEQKASFAIGYDIRKPDVSTFEWENLKEGMLLTTSIEKVKENAPYDIILIYDVIDHTENPADILKTVKELASPDAKIYLRCHPWIGRHSSHLYQTLNKAFVHLLFTENELKSMGYSTDSKKGVLFPLATYKKMISEAGLKIELETVEREAVEPFFLKEPIKTKLLERIGNSKEPNFPEFQMEQSFVDYVLNP